MSNGTDRKPAVCTDRYATAELTLDSASALTYGEVVEVASTLITMKYTPKMNSAEMYASGIAVDGYVSKAGGTADITVVGLSAADEHNYFGSTVSGDGLVTSNKNDVVPDRMIIWSTKSSNGKTNLYKIFKAKFTSQGEQAETTDASGIKYNGTALKADYRNTIYNGNDMCVIKGVDATTTAGAALVSTWFGSAMGGVTSAAIITPISEVFDLNTSSVNNKNICFKLENSALTALKQGTSTLTADTDYVYDSTAKTVTVLRAYLEDLTASDTAYTLTFETADSTNPTATVTVVNSAS